MPFTGTVLQVIPELDAGGAERTTVEMTRAIASAGGRVLVVSAGGRLEDDVRSAGGEIIHLPVDSKNPWVIYRNADRLAAILAEKSVDIIHVRSRAPAWSALWAARKTGVKLISTYHGAYEAGSTLKRFYNSGLIRADRVIANSAFTAASIRAQFQITCGKLVTIPRGAELRMFDPTTVKADRIEKLAALWGVTLEPGPFRLLAPGRLTEWKGQEDVVEALAILAGNSPLPANSGKIGAGQNQKFQLVFCGDVQGRGAFEQALREKIDRRGVRFMTTIVGHCADMPAAYGWADAVLAPSRRPEAFGRVAVEAGAMAKPVIVSSHGGALETVIDGDTGILVPPGDTQALAEAIDEIASKPTVVREEMGLAARAHVAKKYSTEAMCNATLLVYEDMVNAEK